MRNPALITKIEKGSKWSIPCCWLRRGCVNPCTSLSGLPTPCTALIFTNNKSRLKLSFWFQIEKDVKQAIRRHVDSNFWFTTGLIFYGKWKYIYTCPNLCPQFVLLKICLEFLQKFIELRQILALSYCNKNPWIRSTSSNGSTCCTFVH